jgi:hypothetical protein
MSGIKHRVEPIGGQPTPRIDYESPFNYVCRICREPASHGSAVTNVWSDRMQKKIRFYCDKHGKRLMELQRRLMAWKEKK